MSGLHRLEMTRVRRRLGNGSSSPIVVETPGGLFVAKLRGAGHGVAALVAEILVAELAEQLGLPVPERVLLELGPDVPSDDRNDELAQLLGASVGLNLGFRYLEGASEPRREALAQLADEFVARVLWLDGWVMNPDRTASNPNLLFWRRQAWLIDHGSALPFHHRWAAVTEDTPRERSDYSGHVFADRAALLPRHEAELARGASPAALSAAAQKLPDEFLAELGPDRDPARSRAAYAAFLWKRLKPPRPFLPLRA
jgi:hypothetical protein